MCLICKSLTNCSNDPYTGNTTTHAGGSNSSVSSSKQVYTYDQIAYYLTTQFWYDFGTTPRHFDVTQGATLTVNLTGLTAYGQSTARDALEAWTAVSGLLFSETTSSGADIVFDDNDTGAYAYSYTSGGHISQSHINIDDGWSAYGSYYHQTFMHEIGHALGLGHTGSYNGNGDYTTDAIYANDSWQTSVMSYFSQSENTWTDASYRFLATLQLGDIAAIHSLYGAPVNVEAGDSVYGDGATSTRLGMNLSGTYAVAIVDSGGTDEINLASRSQDQNLSLIAETYSDLDGRIGNFSIGRNTVIENAVTGSGNDVITGNAANNRLDGGAGNDQIYAGSGADTLFGGLGDDAIMGDAGNDLITGGAGNDYISGGAGIDWAFFENPFASYSFLQETTVFKVIGDFVDSLLGDIEWLSFSDQTVSFDSLFNSTPAPSQGSHSDFYADGADDLLWRHADGTVFVWDMNVDGSISGQDLGAVSNAWEIKAAGDFYADGADDFLWRHESGTVVIWDKNPGEPLTGRDLGVVDTAWQIKAAGDFYADGADDLLWRHENGKVVIWDMEADESLAGRDLGVVDDAWQLMLTGDFYADGADDLLWRHENGKVVVWDMEADGSLAGRDLGVVDNAWQIKATGDFYADGADDFLWQHSNGTAFIWDMNADGSVVGHDLGVVDSAWQIEAAGNFYADGADDFLWRHSDGTAYVWDMNADGSLSGHNLGAVDNAWGIELLDL